MGSRESDDSLKINLKGAVSDTTGLQFAIVLIILCAFAIGLSVLVYKAQRIVEKSRFELTAENIRSGLRLKVAKLIASDQLSDLKQLIGSNPIVLLDRLPDKYVGVVENENNKYEDGTWQFESSSGELVYKFHRTTMLRILGDEVSEGRVLITAKSESLIGTTGIELKVRVKNGS